jgi:hypothetical protein
VTRGADRDMISALFDIVNAASKSRSVIAALQRRPSTDEIKTTCKFRKRDAPRALLNAPRMPSRDRARAQLVPSFYRMQNPLAGSNGT